MRATEVTLRPYPWNTCHQLLPGLLHLGGDEVADSEDIIPVDGEVLYIVWTPRTIFITKKTNTKANIAKGTTSSMIGAYIAQVRPSTSIE